jgi:signal transduction histidine kinase/CheY-like chemotaxis protein
MPNPQLPPLHRILQMPALWLGIVLSVFLAIYVAHWENTVLRNELRELAKDRVQVLHSNLRSAGEVLHALGSLYAATGEMHEPHFHLFAQDAVARHPELQAVEWIPRVSFAEREAYEAHKRQHGYEAFVFTEIGEAGLLTRAAYRSEYYPVYFLEPFAGNEVAHGFDLGADGRRFAALQQARDSGMPVVTAPVRLAQERSTQQGFLMFYPIYDQPYPLTVAERRERLQGFALAVFRAGDLVSSSLRDIAERGVSVTLYDTGDPYTPLSFHAGKPGAESRWRQLMPWLPRQMKWDMEIDVGGRRWRLVFEPTARFSSRRQPMQTSLALGTGLMLTLLLVAYLASTAQREQEINAANAALQSEIAEREKAVEAAQSANRAKSDFLANMSHEIRTPLNAILGYAQLLRRDRRLDADQRQAVHAIMSSGNHLLSQINSVLDFSKIEIGRMEVELRDLRINDLLQELVLMFRPRCEEKGLSLRVRLLPEEDDLPVRADGCKLRQILINLLGNAVRFTRRGEVMLGCRKASDGRYRFDVIDTGMGIQPQDLVRIFEPFYQGQSQGQAGGTGLGLAIARRHARLLGGDLVAVSEPGEGSRFTLHLPLMPAAEKILPSDREIFQWQLALPRQVRLLVVDDDAANRDILRHMLVAAGCEVAEAADRVGAVQQLENSAFDAVFLDIRMSEGDSLEWLPQLRNPWPNLPVIACTALAFEQDRSRCLAAGCQAFLAKPVQAEAVFDILEKLLRQSPEQVVFAPQWEEVAPPAAENGDQIVLPAELLQRLLTAAELHSTTALKAGIEELLNLGAFTKPLVQQLRQRMSAYDMDAIARLLLSLPVEEEVNVS